MKKWILAVAALAIVGSLASVASATNNVWFAANGSATCTGSATAGPTTGGIAGTRLNLSLNDSLGAGSCSWPIRLMLDYQGDGGDDGILGWALDLYTNSPASKVSATFTAYQSTTAFPTTAEQPPDNAALVPAGSHYILPSPATAPGKGRSRTDGQFNPFGLYPLMDLVITKTKNLGDTNTADIYVRVGTGAWGVDDPSFSQSAGQFQFGPNAPTSENGAAGTQFALPLIRIVNSPEPASLALLGLGALALIRRSR